MHFHAQSVQELKERLCAEAQKCTQDLPEPLWKSGETAKREHYRTASEGAEETLRDEGRAVSVGEDGEED